MFTSASLKAFEESGTKTLSTRENSCDYKSQTRFGQMLESDGARRGSRCREKWLEDKTPTLFMELSAADSVLSPLVLRVL